MLDWTESDYSSNEELSDLLAEFDNRLSSGSGELIGKFLKSGEFAFISIHLKKGLKDQDPYEVHGHVNIDDRYSPLWGQEEFGVLWTIKHYLNEWGYLEQMKDLGFDLGEDFKVVAESVHYDKPFFNPPRGMGFHTQANLVIEQANTKALNLIAEILKTGFRCAEITEILYADESNPQINLNINDQLGTGSPNVNFDEELLYIVGEILQKDREAVLSLRFQDMNDEFFGARIYGDAPLAKYNTPTLLFKDLAKKQIDVNKMVEDFEKFEHLIDIIRANPLPCPDIDIFWKDSGNDRYSGTHYGDADGGKVEMIFDEVVELALKMKELDAMRIGKGSLITLIHQESATRPDDEAIMYGFSAYKLIFPSNKNLVVVINSEGEMDAGKFVANRWERVNLIDPETQDRGISAELYAELKSEFVKY